MALNFSIKRENKWIREYQSDRGNFVDSKYRTFECDASAEVFVKEWVAADAQLRKDMAAAFRFFPFLDQVSDVTTFIANEDRVFGELMEKSVVRSDKDLDANDSEFISGLTLFTAECGEPERMVGQNKWFNAFVDQSGCITIRSLITKKKDFPNEMDLAALRAQTANRAYREAIDIVTKCPFLLKASSDPTAGGTNE